MGLWAQAAAPTTQMGWPEAIFGAVMCAVIAWMMVEMNRDIDK